VTPNRERPIDRLFSLRWDGVDDVVVLVIRGEVDALTAPAVQTALASITRGTSVVIDLTETSFMDSSGLRVLLDAMRNLDRRVHIACVPSGAVRRLIDVVLGAPTEALKLFASRGEALAGFRAQR
jgi:anti-sigma B factor antagonist